VAGEEEAKDGMVDIRSRDNQRIGKMRIDALVQFFNEQTPKPSRSHDNLYGNVWRPEDYPVKSSEEAKEPAQEPAKAE